MKSAFNPEDLGLVNINQTGMNFYVIAYYFGEQFLTLDMLKQYYDIKYIYYKTTGG